ncbi:MAG: PAS domain S-box protein, partial [Verrucomicrobiaceae bacterium]
PPPSSPNSSLERRILLYAPTGNDARLSQGFLQEAGFAVTICRNMPALCREIDKGCAMAMVAEETLGPASTVDFSEALAGQPSWSDLPVTIITGNGESGRRRLRQLMKDGAVGNVTLLERPFHPETLLSHVEAAARTRTWQYQVRDLLHQQQASELRLRDTLESISDAFASLDRDWNFKYVNGSYLKLVAPLHGSAESLLGRNVWEKFPDIVDSEVGRFYRRTMEEQRQGVLEVYYPPLSAWLEICAYPGPEILSLYVRDISERKKEEQAREERRTKDRLLSEILARLLGAHDPHEVMRQLFPQVAAHLGVDAFFNFMITPERDALELQACSGIPQEAAVSLQRLEWGATVCGTAAELRQPVVVSNLQESDDPKVAHIRRLGISAYACYPLVVGEDLLGTLSFASRTLTSFEEEDLEFVRLISQYGAIALNRLHQADQLRASEREHRRIATENAQLYSNMQKAAERLSLALSAGKLGDWSWEAETDVLRMSARTAEIYGVPADAVITRSAMRSLLEEGDRARSLAALRESVRRGQDYSIEYRVNRPDGSRVWVAAKGRPVIDGNGTVTGMLGVVQDITEQKETEEALRDARARVEATLVAAEIGTWRWDITRDVVVADKNLARMFCLPADTLESPINDFFNAVHPADRERLKDSIATAMVTADGELETDYRLLCGDDSVRWVTARAKVERDARGRPLHFPGVVIDITQRKLREREVAELSKKIEDQARLFDATLSHMSDLAYTFDREARVIYANKPLLDLWGVTLEEAVGKNVFDLEYPEELGRRLNSELLEVIHTGRTIRGETSLTSAAGVDDFHEYIYNPVYGPDGTVVAVAGSTRLITERKKEEQALQEAKEAAEAANLAKDRFLAVLSHELRTPLTPVLMTVGVLESEPSLPPNLRSDMAMIRRNVELETKLIDDLLDLSRVSSGKLSLRLEPVELNSLVREVCGICQSQAFEKSLKLECTPLEVPVTVTADPARLQQVFWNIVKNAIKFTPSGGRIQVDAFPVPEGRISVRVRDDGQGIDSAVLPKIFDAFEQGDPRINRQFGGLGLGLAISKALVDMHEGSITAESDGPGQGAVFTVTLPVGGQAPASDPVVTGKPDGDGFRSWRLLLVEDHGDTSRMLSQLLRRRGFTVKTADNVATALELAAAEPFDLVVSDLGLPDATGYDLMRRIRDEYQLPGIAMSGYGMEDDLRRSQEAGFREHIVKPVRIAQLEEAIRRVLGR